jgi:uncharacterized repeat protein (TIGR01451 family)
MRREISTLAGLAALAAAIAVSAAGLAGGGPVGNGGNADLAAVISDGHTTVETNGTMTYNITVTNFGEVAVNDALVTDTPPAELDCGDWICTGENGGSCGAATGDGQISDVVDLPVGGSVNYQLSCRMAEVSSASSVANTVLVDMPLNVQDVNPADNVATDSNGVVRLADLSVTKSNGVDTLAAGAATTYTMVVSNAGPNAVTSVTTDNFPPELQACQWTCTASNGACAPNGSGDFTDSGSLAAGGTLTYRATCTVAPGASGSISNIVSVAVGKGERDKQQINNSATDTDIVSDQPDIAVTIDDGREYVQVGDTLDYTIRLSNPGISSATVDVSSVLPPTLSGAAWMCVPSGGASCTQGSGNTLSDMAGMPAGSAVTYVYSATVQPGGSDGVIAGSASGTSGGDPNPANNSASDTPPDIIVTFRDGFDAPADPPIMPVAPKAGAAQGYYSGSLRIDPQLLSGLGTQPVSVASGYAAGGMELFTLQLARFGEQVMLRAVLSDAAGLDERSAWLAVDPARASINFAWQAAGGDVQDGYLRLGSGSAVQTSAGRAEPLPLAGLRIAQRQSVAWAVLTQD